MSALNVRPKDFFTMNSIVSSKVLGKVSQWRVSPSAMNNE